MGAILIPWLKTSPRCRQYSDINAAAIPLAQIPAAPKTALRENPGGYVLVRHNDTAVAQQLHASYRMVGLRDALSLNSLNSHTSSAQASSERGRKKRLL